MPMYYLYILKKDNEWYIGYTENLKRRIKQHQTYNKVQLVYYESYSEKKLATQREKQLKHYGSAWRALRDRITA